MQVFLEPFSFLKSAARKHEMAEAQLQGKGQRRRSCRDSRRISLHNLPTTTLYLHQRMSSNAEHQDMVHNTHHQRHLTSGASRQPWGYVTLGDNIENCQVPVRSLLQVQSRQTQLAPSVVCGMDICVSSKTYHIIYMCVLIILHVFSYIVCPHIYTHTYTRTHTHTHWRVRRLLDTGTTIYYYISYIHPVYTYILRYILDILLNSTAYYFIIRYTITYVSSKLLILL
jgi:hypothetical protein